MHFFRLYNSINISLVNVLNFLIGNVLLAIYEEGLKFRAKRDSG